jgi:hypothetical protein
MEGAWKGIGSVMHNSSLKRTPEAAAKLGEIRSQCRLSVDDPVVNRGSKPLGIPSEGSKS